MSIAKHHPATINKPERGSGAPKRVMHSIHTAILRSGRLANRKIVRKAPNWPVKADNISVLGYGAEKVAYRVSVEDQKDIAISVYHRETFGRNPLDVAKQKKENYDAYRKYFGALVVPTFFTIVDNPWGEGSKPATIAPYLEGTQEFSSLTQRDIMARADRDSKFSVQLEQLQAGYNAMRTDGLVPDLAASNLLVSGSDILIFDTGTLYTDKRLPQLTSLHANYGVLDSLANQQ